jgi:hypothetical protein
MFRAPRNALIVVAAALCGVATATATATSVAQPPATSAQPSSPLGGVNIFGLGFGSRPAEADREIALAQRMHAKVVRIDLPWAVLQPHGPNEFDAQAQAFTDRVVADAAAAGIGVIMTARATPCWDSSAPADVLSHCSTTRLTDANAWPPRNLAAYGAFVAYLAQRYGTRLAGIEIWNEPDQINELYFAGREKAKRYAAVLRAAYPAIKQANPNVRVLAGSLVGSNGIFLRALYKAGIKGYYDALAVHFYTLTLASLRAFRQVQLENGDSKPLWLDEFGWSSCWPRHRIEQEQACVTARVQATNIANVFRSLARSTYVGAELTYQLMDVRNEEFGAVTASGAPKPAFAALSSVLASPFGAVSPVTLSLKRRGGRVLASGGGPVGDVMGLEAFNGRVLRYRAEFTLDRFNRYSITLPRALGSSGLRIRVFQLWSALGGTAQKSI